LYLIVTMLFDKLNISPDIYYEMSLWWSELQDLVDCDGLYKSIIWNNREIKIDGKSVFYKQYLSKGIKYTKDLNSQALSLPTV